MHRRVGAGYRGLELLDVLWALWLSHWAVTGLGAAGVPLLCTFIRYAAWGDWGSNIADKDTAQGSVSGSVAMGELDRVQTKLQFESRKTPKTRADGVQAPDRVLEGAPAESDADLKQILVIHAA
ncbi:hypothetical protein NDU88_002475 [Pleurodeles waltl]|uniref:Uncharacterized protein n=1 Tax=Pleurodeles waltl TaxID=8319 RepID=A0AAV7WLC4_PLEWA|nr:hypothetical protein NDU88_002475 [Pleurodeles waltl]